MSDFNNTLEDFPISEEPFKIVTGRQMPGRGKAVIAPLFSEGTDFGVVMIPHRNDRARAQVDALADVGPALGKVYQKKLSQRDALTDLYNRHEFERRLVEDKRRCKAIGESLSLIMLDIDNFGMFNKIYSYETGDWVLYEVTSTLRKGRRFGGKRSRTEPVSDQFSARLGGEEMAVLADGHTLEQTVAAAEGIRKDIEELRVPTDGAQLRVTVSIGVSFCRLGSDPSLMLEKADVALRRAKQKGKNRVEYEEL